MNRIERLLEIVHKPTRRMIGLMSGTSVDTIDVAIFEIEGRAAFVSVRQRAFESSPFPPGPRGPAAILETMRRHSLSIAVISNDSVAGLPTNVPGATGGRPAIFGKIIP